MKTFTVNQKVVYPSQGVGIIISIEDKEFKNETIPYYKIYFEGSDMTIMVPIHQAEVSGIRAIVSEEDAQKALDLISEEYEPFPSDWKIRYQLNLDLLKKGSVMDIATIVRSLYHRSKVKELPILERKLYDSALKLLEDEISFALHLSKNEVEEIIFNRLDKKPIPPEELAGEDLQIAVEYSAEEEIKETEVSEAETSYETQEKHSGDN